MMDEKQNNQHVSASAALSDEQRVRVLSPSMLVFKRFIRNRLAITGFVILLVMFAFSFLGGFLMPYTQSQVFKTYGVMEKDYASATVNAEVRYTVREGASFPTSARAQFALALTKGATTFADGAAAYTVFPLGEDSYRIEQLEELSNVMTIKGKYAYSEKGAPLPDEIKAAFEAAHAAGESSFVLDNETYTIVQAGKGLLLARAADVAVASMRIFDPYAQEDAETVASFPFKRAALTAIAANETAFALAGEDYEIRYEDGSCVVTRQGNPFADVSNIIVNPTGNGVFLDMPFKFAVREAIADQVKTLTIEGVDYTVNLVHNTYTILAETETQLIDMYDYPSRTHLLGTDGNGMDVLTRLMYGGRISLMVGFVVVIIETLIGVIVGGVSGYFGGWVDTLLMRFVDLFNCIPYWPMMIIAGAVMDTLEVDPYVRIFLLMFIMGLMGWTGVARVVRGQILTLREQDFMVATEATGIRVSRRIFRHLVPNVMPLLIVQATMGLGSIIITEATLSFLGLGVKYPLASWGSIINSATNLHVMTNYWFIWIPAGVLILLTVLGFNFVGDGLRDAFDPKMKR